jgi:hypothetical protein
MGLSTHLVTACLLSAALAVELLLPRVDERDAIAKRLLGSNELQRLEIAGQPAYRAGSRWVVFFAGPGKVDRIHGAMVIEDDTIRDLVILSAREGIDLSGFAGGPVPASFRGQAARAPVEVHAATGATISSRRLADTVDRQLIRWREAVR